MECLSRSTSRTTRKQFYRLDIGFDVSVTRDNGIGRMLRDSVHSIREAIVVAYYSRESDLDSPTATQEAHELTELAVPLARRFGDSLIVVQSTSTIAPRWSPFVRGRIHFFVCTSGEDWREVIP